MCGVLVIKAENAAGAACPLCSDRIAKVVGMSQTCSQAIAKARE